MTTDGAAIGDQVTVELRGPDGKLRRPVQETPVDVHPDETDTQDDTRSARDE
jgi:hypothetical protein